MSGCFYLAFRYLAYHRMTTAWLVLCIGLTLALPLATRLTLSRFETQLLRRANQTPLLIGAKGSRFELAIHALHYSGTPPEEIRYGEVVRAQQTGYVDVIPIHASARTVGDRKQPQGYPIVGTSIDYFQLRRLGFKSGSPFRRMGECVVGSQVAKAKGLAVGDSVLSESQNPYDLSASPPLKMKVVGILDKSYSDDDDAVFADLNTIWIIQGLGHGHLDLTTTKDEGLLLGRDGDELVGSPAVTEFIEITEENLNSFHFHGNPDDFPVTAVIALPKNEDAATLFEGRYLGADETVQIIQPPQVMRELLQRIFRAQKFFDVVMGVVSLITAMFVGLVWMLSRQLRTREMETIFKMGASRATKFWIQFFELFLILMMSIILAALLGTTALALLPSLVRQLVF